MVFLWLRSLSPLSFGHSFALSVFSHRSFADAHSTRLFARLVALAHRSERLNIKQTLALFRRFHSYELFGLLSFSRLVWFHRARLRIAFGRASRGTRARVSIIVALWNIALGLRAWLLALSRSKLGGPGWIVHMKTDKITNWFHSHQALVSFASLARSSRVIGRASRLVLRSFGWFARSRQLIDSCVADNGQNNSGTKDNNKPEQQTAQMK